MYSEKKQEDRMAGIGGRIISVNKDGCLYLTYRLWTVLCSHCDTSVTFVSQVAGTPFQHKHILANSFKPVCVCTVFIQVNSMVNFSNSQLSTELSLASALCCRFRSCSSLLSCTLLNSVKSQRRESALLICFLPSDSLMPPQIFLCALSPSGNQSFREFS